MGHADNGANNHNDDRRSPAHDMDCQNAALMPPQQVVDEVADDGIRLVAGFRD
jgi:hypothetical protein